MVHSFCTILIIFLLKHLAIDKNTLKENGTQVLNNVQIVHQNTHLAVLACHDWLSCLRAKLIILLQETVMGRVKWVQTQFNSTMTKKLSNYAFKFIFHNYHTFTEKNTKGVSWMSKQIYLRYVTGRQLHPHLKI